MKNVALQNISNLNYEKKEDLRYSFRDMFLKRKYILNDQTSFVSPTIESFLLICSSLKDFKVASPILVFPVTATSNKHSLFSPQTDLARLSKSSSENNVFDSSKNIGVNV